MIPRVKLLRKKVSPSKVKNMYIHPSEQRIIRALCDYYLEKHSEVGWESDPAQILDVGKKEGLNEIRTSAICRIENIERE